MNDGDLRTALLAASVLRGSFTLRSGDVSSYYIDKYRFQARPQLLRRVAAALVELLPAETQRLAGVELGAVPLVTAVALESGIPFVIVRKGSKDYGTEKLIEGEPLAGAAVTLIEDIWTTGGASLEAAAKIAPAGGRLLKIVAVLDRGGGIDRIRSAGYNAQALFTLAPGELE